MKDKTQYNQLGVSSTVGVVPPPKQGLTKSPAERKVEELEHQLTNQHQEILKLRRDISRLKSDISDVITIINSRG
jgi:peptidoglycan hydrolase CwlO-like protein